MSNQSIINPDNSKSHLEGIIDVTKLKANTDPSLVKTSFVGQVNKYDRNFVMAANDPMGPKTREQNRLINQPTSSAFINAGIQAASEIGLGTLEGAGFLLDIPQWVNTIKGTERDFGNWFSDSIGELKKEVAEDNPIYAVDGYHPTNAKWWASMIPSIATSASLMIPSMGGAKLMSTVGKLSSKLAKGIANNSKAANLLAKGLEKTGAGLQNYTGVSAAVFSRMAEGTLEATEAGTQAYQKYMEQGMSMEEATEKAGQASAATFLGNMPLLALDLLQYNSIFKQFGSKVGIQAAENALDLSTKSLARRTLQKTWNTLKVPIGEGAEEGLQFGVKEESIKMAEDGMPENRVDILMKQYSDIAKNVLPEYFNNDEFLTSITLGAVGGKVFDVITPAVRRLAKMDNSVDEDLRSGKLVAPYYKTRKAFIDLLQQDEVKANEMLEAAKTDPKLNKLGELDSFENLLTVYNDLKSDEELMKNPNAGLLMKSELESVLYKDLATQLEAKNIEIPEGIEDFDLKLDALSQLESYELQSPKANPRNLQFIKARKNELLAEKSEKETALGVKTTYKPKEGYSWGSRTHRAAINHHANIEMSKILSNISNLKYQNYLSENGSMYAGLDAKIEKSLETIDDLTSLRGSEEFDTDDKYLDFLLDLKTKRTDLKEEVNLILDDIYKENISDETHPINKVVYNEITNSVEDVTYLNDLARIDEINRNSPKFRNLFSHGVSTNFLVSPNTTKYATKPKPEIGSVVKMNDNEFLLYKKEDTKGFFKSLTDETDNFELELSAVKPTDIVKSYRIVKDFESNSNLILLEDKAVIVNDGTTVYERNSSEGINRHDLLSELSYPEIYNLEESRRKELEKVDVRIPALKTIGSPVNLTPFTLGNKSKASRKEAARNLNLKNGDTVKLWFYEKDSKIAHAIPFIFINGELLDTTNPYYNPKLDDRIFVKAQKYETQIDYNNKQYNAINDKYNFKYIELLEQGKLEPSQVYTILKNKNVEDSIDLWEAYYNVATTKFKINSDEDIDNILNVLKYKGITIKKRGDSRLDGSKIEKGYEINGEAYKSVTELIEIISPYDKLNKTFQGAINAGNFIDELSREIFTSDEINRVLLTNKYKSKFANVETLNDAINLIATNKINLQKKGFKFVTTNVVLFDKSSGKNVAGEIDLLAYDNLGNIHIMDFKTFTDNSYSEYSNKKESIEKLTKRDRYRTQLSTYAELFNNLTGYKVSGINIIPYVLNYDADTGIIDSVTSKSIDDFKVISKINPISFRHESFNSSYELLKIMEKTDDAIITKSNLSKVFSSSNKSLNSKIQYLDTKTFIPTENTLNIEHVITHINDFLTKFNGYKSVLSKEELAIIDNYNDIVNKLISVNNFDFEKAVITSGITSFESYVKGEQENNLCYTFQKLPEMLVAINNNKVYQLDVDDIRYSLKKKVDLATDSFLFVINDNNYILTPEEYTNFIDEGYTRETLTEKILQPYLVTDLMDDAIYYQYKINEVEDEVDSDTIDIEDLKDINKTNKKILTIESTNNAIDLMQENNVINYITLLEKYFVDNNEESLLKNVLELETILQNSLNDIVTQLDTITSEDELYEDLISKMNTLDDLINTIKDFTNNLNTFIINEDESITQDNIDDMLYNLLDKLDTIELNTPISDEDLQDLKDIASTVIKPIELPQKKKTVKQNRTLKNKYKNKFIYITKDAVKDLFSKVSSDYIVNTDKLFEEYLVSNNILPENITTNTYSNFKKLLPKDRTYITTNIEFISISDNIIYYSVPPPNDAKFYKRELGLIESNIEYGGEEEIKKIDLLRRNDNVIDLLTTGNKVISDDTINEARELYSFNYDGVELDENVPYNPFLSTTLVTRSDFYNSEKSELAKNKDRFYSRKSFIPTDDSDKLYNILPDLFNGKVVEINNLPIIKSSNVMEDFENLYNKKKENLLKDKVSVLVRKTENNKYIIVFANKEYINDSVKFTPIGIMNTIEQAVYAYEKTKTKRESVFLTKLIREDIELLASNNPTGELIEVNYDKINLLDVRSTGLNRLDSPKSVYDVLKDKNNPQLIIHINGKFVSNFNILDSNLENLKNTYKLKENNSLNIFYNTTDKLGKQVPIGSTLKFYKNAHDDYKLSVERLVKSIINNRDKKDIKSLKSDILELGKGYVNIPKLNKNSPDGEFLKYASQFNDINEFNAKYDPNGTMTMRIDFIKLQEDNSYAINVAKNYLTSTIDIEPYANIQYFFGIIKNDKNTNELDESLELEEEVLDDIIEEEFEDKVIVNTNILLNDEGSFKINKPTSLKYYLQQQLKKDSIYINELSNSYNANESILTGFNELLTDLNNLDTDSSLYNVVNHILKYTNNTSLKNINKTLADIVKNYNDTNDNKINTLRNYVDSFKEYVINNQQTVIDFYTEAVDNSYYIENNVEMSIHDLRRASEALLSLAIQNGLDFRDFKNIKNNVKGSSSNNFFLNDLVTLLLEKADNGNISTITKIVKALRKDITTIELGENNEIVLIRNEVNYRKPTGGILYNQLLKSLKVYGYDVDINTPSYEQDYEDEIPNLEEIVDNNESWSELIKFQFPTTNLSRNVKVLLQSIESPELDKLGLNINLNYPLSMAYGIVMDKLVNSIDVNDVKNRLQNEFNDIPYIKRLNSYIMNQENADELYSQIYTSIGNKIRLTYETVIKDRRGNIYGSLSNRQSYEFIISERLNSDVKNNIKHTPGSILDILNLYERDITSVLVNQTAVQSIKELIDVYEKGLAYYNSLKSDTERNKYTFTLRYSYDGKTVNVSSLIKSAIKYIPKSGTTYHMTVKDKIQYQDTNSNFLGYIQNNSDKYYAMLLKDSSFASLPVVQRKNPIDVIQVIGYDDQRGSIGYEISKLNSKLATEMMLVMHKRNAYPIAVPGDIGNALYVKGLMPIEKTKENIYNELYELMLFEKNRVDSNEESSVKVYNKKKSDYIIFNKVNDILKEKNLSFNKSNVLIAFDDFFEKNYVEYINYLRELDIVSNDGKFQSNLQGYDKNNSEQDIRNFLLSYALGVTNILLLTNNDLAYYKSIEDIFKRGKQVVSSGERINTLNTYTNRTTKEIVSIPEKIKILIYEDVKDEFKDSEEYKNIAKALNSTNLKNKENIISEFDRTSLTDGQSYIDLISYRQRMVSLSLWSDDQQDMMDELMNGGSITAYNKKRNLSSKDSPFNVIKPFFFANTSSIKRDALDNQDKVQPFQKKDSEFIITPNYGLKKVNSKEKELIDNPLYNQFFRDLLEKMGYVFNDTTHKVSFVESKRTIDMASSNEAIKVGESNTVKPDNLKDGAIEIPFEFWMKQNETPKGHFSKDSIFGTQIMKIITSNISDDAKFTIGDKVYSKKDLVQKYDSLLMEDLKYSYEELKNRFKRNKNDDNVSFEMLVNHLKGIFADDTLNLQKALEIIVENGEISTTLPLSHPVLTAKVQPKLNAEYRNSVTVRRFSKGYKAANVSPYGFKNKPRIVWNTNKDGVEDPALGIKHFEVISPIHDKRIYEFVDEVSGLVDMKKLEETYPELLDGVLYRIPTEDLYSIFKVKIIGFLTDDMGAVIMPSSLTTLSGLDFDIDKMFGFFKDVIPKEEDYQYIHEELVDLKSVYSSQIKEIIDAYGKEFKDYPKEIKDKKAQIDAEYKAAKTLILNSNKFKESYESYIKMAQSDNDKLDIMMAVLSNKDSLKTQLNPGGFKVIEKAVLDYKFYDLYDANGNPPITEEQYSKKDDSAKNSYLSNKSYSFLSPILISEVQIAMNVGKDMTGIAANHNAARTIMQRSGIKFSNKLKVIFDGIERTLNINNIRDFTGNIITKSISTVLAAVLDNGKNPLIKYFGLSLDNYNIPDKYNEGEQISTSVPNTFLAVLHLGYPIEVAMTFNKAFTNLLKHSVLTKKEKKKIELDILDSEEYVIDLNNNELITYLKHYNFIKDKKRSKELIAIEQKLYKNFILISQIGYDINKVVTYTQRGNRGAKSTYFENHLDILDYKTYLSEDINYAKNFFDVNTLEDYFSEKSNTFINDFNNFIETQFNDINTYLSFPDISLSDRKNNASIATLIESDKYFRRKDDKLLKKIYNAIYYKATIDSYPDYFAEKIDTIDKYLNKNTWNKIKKKYKDNNFIKSLKLDNTYEGEGIKLIINTDFKDTYKNDELTDEWYKLMFSRDKEETKVGELLAVYSLYTSGYDIGYGTFNQLIPIEFYNQVLPNYSKTLMNTIKQMLEDPLAGLDIFAMVMHKYKGLSRFINKNNVSAEYNSNVRFKENVIIDNVLNSTDTVYYKTSEELFSRLDIDYDKVNDVPLLDDSLGDMPSFSDELNPEIQIENDFINTQQSNITPVANIPQNKISGIESYGSTVTANDEVIKILGKNPHSIDMVEAGLRTRTTRSESEMSKYNIKVGDVIKHFGISADGTTKNILARVIAIYPKNSTEWKTTWNKEGWRAEDVNVIDKFKDGAAAIEFEVIQSQFEPKIIIDETKPEFNKLPNKSITPTMTYAGIGSRETPQEVLDKMTEVAKYLEELGYTLRSGRAIGADKAFEKGVKSKKEVFLGSVKTGEKELKIAEEIHPAWDKMLESTKRKAIASGKNPEKSADYVANLMARNTNQIFGANLDTPVDFVLAWTQDGLTDYRKRSLQSGGTGQAIDMASRKGIPVINMANDNWRDELKSVIVKSQQSNIVSEENKLTKEEADWLIDNLYSINIKYQSVTLSGSIDSELKKPLVFGKTIVKAIEPIAGDKSHIWFERPTGKWLIIIDEKDNKPKIEIAKFSTDKKMEGYYGISISDKQKEELILESGLNDLINSIFKDTNIEQPFTRLEQLEAQNSLQQKYGLKRTYKDIFNELNNKDNYSIKELKQNSNIEKDAIKFTRKDSKTDKGYFEEFSNFTSSNVEIEDMFGLKYKTVEHYYQAQKTLNPTERKQFTDKSMTANQAKKLGNDKEKLTLISNWETVKFDVMREGLRQKFQDKKFMDLLKSTGNKQIIEWTWWGDKIWGMSDKTNDGANALGKLLMELRDSNQETQTTETREYTPENITSLKSNEVFVFGSNARGIHGKGAALTAKEKFGAIQRQAEGLQGQSYAIITKKNVRVEKSSTLQEIGKGIQDMLLFAKENTNLKFYVTKIGTENAGYSIPEIKGLFEKLRNYIPNNVILPKEFEVRDIQQSETPIIKVDKTLITEEPIVNAKPSTTTTVDKKMESDIDTYLKNKNSKLNDDQRQTMKLVYDRFKTKSSKMVVINGKAGTGKTFMLKELISYINSTLDKNSRIGVLGSSIANNIKNNLKTVIQDNTNSNIIYGFQSVNSILGIADDKRIKTSQGFSGKEKDLPKDGILLVDEASMINSEYFRRLKRKAEDTNTFIIYVGDSGQLFPVHGDEMPVFSSVPKSDQFSLTKAMRQKPNSLIIQYSNQFWDKAHKIDTKEIAIPNKINKDGGVVEITTVNSDNIFEAFNYAVKNEKLDYIRFITASNKGVDNFNKDIHEYLFPNQEYGNGEFMSFNSNYLLEYKDILKVSADNATKFIVKEKLTDSQITLMPKLNTEINIGDFKLELKYDYFNVMIGNKPNVLPILTRNSYIKLNKAIELYKEDDYEATEQEIISNFVHQFPDVSYDYANTLHKAQGLTFDIVIYDKGTTEWLKSTGNKGQDNAFYTATTRPKNLLLITGTVDKKASPTAIPAKKLGSIIEINTNITNSTQEDVTFDKSKPTERERTSTETKTQPTETKTSSSGLEMGNVYNYKGVDYVYLFDDEGLSYYIDTVENDIVEDLPTNLPIKKQFETVIGDNGFIYVHNTDKKSVYVYVNKTGNLKLIPNDGYDLYIKRYFC